MIPSTEIVLVGESCVGKTSIIDRFTHNSFKIQTKPTIGSQYHQIKSPYQEIEFLFKIWDTPGQKPHRRVVSSLLKKADVIIAVFDMTRRGTLEQLKNYWFPKIIQKAQDRETILMLYGNKNDKAVKEEDVEETNKIIRKYREQFDFIFFCGSASDANDKTIDKMMQKILYILYNNLKREKMLDEYKLKKKERSFHQEEEEKVGKKQKLGGMIKSVFQVFKKKSSSSID